MREENDDAEVSRRGFSERERVETRMKK